jgi:hypothetical protein
VHQRVEAKFLQRTQVQILNIIGTRLQQDLELVVVLQAIGVFTIATVSGTA